jgi:iron(III) transport system permease protein
LSVVDHTAPAYRWRGFAFALPIALLTIVPLLAVVGMALTPQPDIWQHLWNHVLPRVLANTLLLMLIVSIVVLAVGVPLAWLTAMCDFPGRKFFAWALVLPLAIPAYVLAFVQMGLFEYAGPVQSFLRDIFGSSRWFPDIRGSLWGLVMVLVMAFYPYVYLMARSAFLTQGHRSMEAAQALGYSPVAAFFKVGLPLARPWIGAGLALVLMEVLADFGAIAVFNFDTFTTALYKSWFDLHNIGAAAQLAAMLVLVVTLLLAAEQRSRSAQRFHVSNPQQYRVVLKGGSRWVAFVLCLLVFSAAFAVPMVQMVAWSLSVWQDDLNSDYWSYAWNTLSLALMTAAIATVLALMLSWIRRRYTDGLTSWTVRLAVLGYAMPGVVLAVGVFVPIAWLDAWLMALLEPWGVQSLGIIKGSLAGMLLALAARFFGAGAVADLAPLAPSAAAHRFAVCFSDGGSGRDEGDAHHADDAPVRLGHLGRACVPAHIRIHVGSSRFACFGYCAGGFVARDFTGAANGKDTVFRRLNIAEIFECLKLKTFRWAMAPPSWCKT